VQNLSQEQIQAIFAGRVRNWSEVPGSRTSGAIDLVVRTAASGTQDAFQNIFMGGPRGSRIASSASQRSSNGLVQSSVRSNRNAIGYVDFRFISGTNPVSYRGVACNLRNAQAGTYGGVRNFWFVTRNAPSGATARFVRFARSSAGPAHRRQELGPASARWRLRPPHPHRRGATRPRGGLLEAAAGRGRDRRAEAPARRVACTVCSSWWGWSSFVFANAEAVVPPANGLGLFGSPPAGSYRRRAAVDDLQRPPTPRGGPTSCPRVPQSVVHRADHRGRGDPRDDLRDARRRLPRRVRARGRPARPRPRGHLLAGVPSVVYGLIGSSSSRRSSPGSSPRTARSRSRA
jgi:hypothetical protein